MVNIGFKDDLEGTREEDIEGDSCCCHRLFEVEVVISHIHKVAQLFQFQVFSVS